MSTNEIISDLEQMASNTTILFGRVIGEPEKIQGYDEEFCYRTKLFIKDGRDNSTIDIWVWKDAAEDISENYKEGLYVGIRGYLQSYHGLLALITPSVTLFLPDGDKIYCEYDDIFEKEFYS